MKKLRMRKLIRILWRLSIVLWLLIGAIIMGLSVPIWIFTGNGFYFFDEDRFMISWLNKIF